jgi:phosphate acetyltransferase
MWVDVDRLGFVQALKWSVQDRGFVIVFPEGSDTRIIRAARDLIDERISSVILLGSRTEIERAASAADISLKEITIIDPARSDRRSRYVNTYITRRPRVTRAAANRLMQKPLYFGGAMVSNGDAHAMIAGAATTTSNVIKASLTTIGLHESVRTPSSAFFLLFPSQNDNGERPLLFADCALNIMPSAEQLADIAIASARTYRFLAHDAPRVALLSFSTHGSGNHASIAKIREAVAIVRSREPKLAIDGELQADAALVPHIASRKIRHNSSVAGHANVLVFPDLNSGNIAYKLTALMGNAVALGPLLQGFRKPVSDLSRGATSTEVTQTAVLTLAGINDSN